MADVKKSNAALVQVFTNQFKNTFDLCKQQLSAIEFNSLNVSIFYFLYYEKRALSHN